MQFTENELTLRCLDEHKRMCGKLLATTDPQSLVKRSKRYGINVQSTLMSLEYFDLCSGALVPDVMHDVLEGVLQYEMKLLLCHCIFNKKYFTASFLTHLMEVFELGYMEISNRPTPITKTLLKKKTNSLNQNGKNIVYMYMYVV